MDVTSAEPPSTFFPATDTSNSTRYMDSNMDVDMDIDLGVDLEIADEDAMNIESSVPERAPEQPNGRSNDTVANALDQLVYDKVHVRGLDNLATEDVKAFASAYFAPEIVRLEWVDDTSANLVYENPETASQALVTFTNTANDNLDSLDPFDLRKTKPHPTHHNTELYVRMAVVTDVKKPRARDASRFYLMNPDKDPRERRQQYDDRYGRGSRNGDRRRKRQRDEESSAPFDVNMYDDDPESLAARRPTGRDRGRSRSMHESDESRGGKRTRYRDRQNGDLFGDRVQKSGGGSGMLRDRSASPVLGAREGDGRLGFTENASNGGRFRRSSATPPGARERSFGNANAGKELLGAPRTAASGGMQSPSSNSGGRELFPEKSPPKEAASKELFPRKGSFAGHRRSGAFDAADVTADLFANSRRGDGRAEAGTKPRSLADRITGGPRDLDQRSPQDNNGQLEGINIRGTAQQDSPGFSIRGAAKAMGLENPRVKELFPEKSDGNAGKELFGTKIKGRSGPRKTAEDMF